MDNIAVTIDGVATRREVNKAIREFPLSRQLKAARGPMKRASATSEAASLHRDSLVPDTPPGRKGVWAREEGVRHRPVGKGAPAVCRPPGWGRFTDTCRQGVGWKVRPAILRLPRGSGASVAAA
jgi:hypothetical protein